MRELEIGYDSTLLGPLNLEIPRESFLLIEGPNGIGKSTLLKTIIGLRAERAGSYQWEVEAKHLRFVPQIRTLDALLPATVGDVMETGFQRGSGWPALRKGPRRGDEILRALERVGMAERRKDLFRELSEGQKQLVLLARALLAEPAVILLDEPSASMDPRREQQAVDILRGEQHERGCTIFMIAHGSRAARAAADHVLGIDYERGVSLEEVTPEAATSRDLALKTVPTEEKKCGTH
jgi:ABC-type Mn2+/Zn2+ transport system ATPase subunit